MSVLGAGEAFMLASGEDAGYTIQRSLRFDSSSSSHLSRTPSSAGNRKTWTWSGWVKRSALTTTGGQILFSAGLYTNNVVADLVLLGFQSSSGTGADTLDMYVAGTRITTSAVYRDPSAWMHIVFAFDSTQSTDANKSIIYVNGVRQSVSGTYVATNTQSGVNKSGNLHNIGRYTHSGTRYFSGYLAEVNFVDGQALAPTDFGGYDSDNNWNPKNTSGLTFGTNGYYLKFADNSSVSALGTDSSGNSNNWTPNNFTIEGSVLGEPVGGNYDSEASTYSTSGTISQETGQTLPYTAAHYEGNVLRSNPSVATGGVKIVTTNPAYQEFFLSAWIKFDALESKQMGVDLSGDYIYWEMLSNGKIKIRHVGGNGVTSGSVVLTNNTWHHCALSRSGNTLYGFVDGVVAVSTTSGVPSGGDSIAANENWWFFFNPYETGFRMLDVCIFAGQGRSTNFTAPTGPLIGSDGSITNPASLPDTYRVYASPMIGLEGISEVDSVLDTPINYTADSGNNGGNYATLNPLDFKGGTPTLANGNLDASIAAANAWGSVAATIGGLTSNKWYWEVKLGGGSGHRTGLSSVSRSNASNDQLLGSGDIAVNSNDGRVYVDGSAVGTGVGSLSGKTVGIALNLDANSVSFYQNNSLIHTVSSLSSTASWTPVHAFRYDSIDNLNFGQRPFQYPPGGTGGPSSDYKSLCTTNLDDPLIADGRDYFAAKTYTGNAGTQAITGLEFSPDFLWIKNRTDSSAAAHRLFDTVRGANKTLFSNLTNDELEVANSLTSFDSNGFTVGSGNWVNGSNDGIVAWAWDAGTVGTNEVGDYWSPPTYQTKYIGFKFPTSSGGRAVFGLIAGTGTADIYTSSDNSNWTRVQSNVTLSTTDTTYDSTFQYLLVVNTADAVWNNRHYAMATSGTDAHYSTTVYPGSGASFTWSGPGYTDWDFRSSGTVIKPGSLNSSVYDQSQTWSTYGSTSSGGYASGLGIERGFNGDTSNQVEGDTTGAYFSIPFSTTIASGDVGFVSYASAGDGHMKLYNGSTEVDDVGSSGNSQFRYSTYAGPITEIRISRDGRAFEFAAVSVFGKILVDQGVTPAVSVPSIASTVRANQTAGMSIVSWQSRGTNNDSVAHGLNKKPDLWIMKSRSAAKDWYVYTDVIDGSIDYVVLNDSDSKNNSSSTAPTSNVFHVYGSVVNSSNEDLIGYFFNSVEGYSAFGSYIGNGSTTNGSFVFLDFTPALVIIKNTESSSSYSSWGMWDSARNINAPALSSLNDPLWANRSAAEGKRGNGSDNASGSDNTVHLLSNGFQVFGNGAEYNNNNVKYIYAAFASHPFKTARAR
tara:strand:- start:142 stop:4104 length:3963 start_codon:yes stop_codon:yes gene_type:complete